MKIQKKTKKIKKSLKKLNGNLIITHDYYSFE